MYKSGYKRNKETRRLRDRRAEDAKQWRRANEVHITSETSTTSLAKILCFIWHSQEAGWCVIRAHNRGRHEELWSWSDKLKRKKLKRWLDDHRGWHVEFCPVTFERNLEHLNWTLFERGRWNARLREYDPINRRECLSYLEYGPLERSEEFGREPDIIIADEDKGIWFTDHPSYIDYEARDGLFVWLPKQQLTADELLDMHGQAGLWRDMRVFGSDRSAVTWRLGKTCVNKKGMRDPDDIKTIIRASAAFQSRLEERGEFQMERGLDADVRKLLRETQ